MRAAVARYFAHFLKSLLKVFSFFSLLVFRADRPGLKGIGEIGRLSQAVVRALCLELDKNHSVPIKGDVTVSDALLTKIPTLR